MSKLISLFSRIIKSWEPVLLMSDGDADAITVSIDSRVMDVPQVFCSLNYLERNRYLTADKYMSKKLLDAFLVYVDFEDPRNRQNFESFARELLSFRYRGDKYEVLGHKTYFILHNITGDFHYRQNFAK